MNPSTLANIIQQLIAAREENYALIEECARLNQMLHPLPEPEPEIQQEPEQEPEQDLLSKIVHDCLDDQQEKPEEQEEQEPKPGAATSIARAWPIIADASEETNL